MPPRNNSERLNKLEIKVSGVLEKTDSAHKRLDDHAGEIKSLRDSRHEHAGYIQRHDGIILGIESAVTGLNKTVVQNTKSIVELITMARTAIVMGGGFISFVVFAGGKILKWW